MQTSAGRVKWRSGWECFNPPCTKNSNALQSLYQRPPRYPTVPQSWKSQWLLCGTLPPAQEMRCLLCGSGKIRIQEFDAVRHKRRQCVIAHCIDCQSSWEAPTREALLEVISPPLPNG